VWYLLALLVAGFLAWRIIGQAIEKELLPWQALAYLAGLLAFTGVMIRHVHDPIGPSIAFIIIALGLLHNVLGYWINQSQLAAIRAQDMQECQRMIQERPEIPYPYKMMGDLLLERGMLDEAASYYKKALSLSDDPEVKWKLKQCQQIARRRQLGLTVCPQCLSEVPRGSKECPVCGRYLALSLANPGDSVRWAAAVLAGVACVVAAVAGAIALGRVSPWLVPIPFLVLAAVAALRISYLRSVPRTPRPR
jgi:tetratricopeptide (TPR) repeat protein